jgi:hypothetical protein
MRYLPLLILLTLLTPAFVIAIQPTQQTNKIYLDPFYKDTFPANTRMNYTFTIQSPDGFSSVTSAIITFHSYIAPTVTYNLIVNGQSCNTPTYTVSTSQAGAGVADLSFDCSNIIKTEGTYTAQLWTTTKTTGATTATLDITYTNNPKGTLNVHGTEYQPQQPGKLWLQLINSTGSNIDNGVCYIDIYTPAGGYYIEHAQMTNMVHDGIYYYDLETPLTHGVYPAIASCYYTATSVNYYVTNYTINTGTYSSGAITDLTTVDGNFMRFKEAQINEKDRIDLTLNFTNLGTCMNVSQSLLTGFTIKIYAKFDSVVNDNIDINIYNNTNQKWIRLPNRLLEGNTFGYAINTITTNNITSSGYYNTTRGIRIRLNDTTLSDGSISNLDIDQAILTCDQLSNQGWQEVKGSSEMHINPATSGLGLPYYVYTLCGDPDNIQSTSSSCAEVHYGNYNGFTEPQGWLQDNTTFINNAQNDVNSFFDYETPVGVDCTAILDIYEIRNGIHTDLYNQTIFKEGNKPDNCIASNPINMNSTENDYQIIYVMDDFVKWEVNRANRLISFYRQDIENFCNELASISSVNMTVPILTNLSQYSMNTPLLGCWQSLDDLYWFDNYYNTSQTATTAGDMITSLIGARYYYPEILNSFHTVQALKTNQLELYAVQTLCEKLSGKDIPGSDDFGCQILHAPDNFFTSQEGYTIGNTTFTNTYQTSFDSTFIWESPIDTDCTAILTIERIDTNGTATNLLPLVQQRPGDKANCKLILPITFTPSQNTFDIIIKLQNYIHWNMYQMKDKINAVRNNTIPFCQNQLSTDNITYTLPINASIDYIPYFLDRFCLRTLDDYYWFDFYDTLHQAAVHTGNGTHYLYDLLPTYYEFKYFYPFILEDELTIKVIEDRNLLNILISNTSAMVWHYNNRTLTQSINVNLTSVTDRLDTINNTLTNVNTNTYNTYTYLTTNTTTLLNTILTYASPPDMRAIT